ncbi:MAG TPA: DUF1697 domain-containing protein [Thermoanaerobaculia bacterium]|nr:DUF1697 domain-containing protein [Thermoanaerobaculia bacterium]
MLYIALLRGINVGGHKKVAMSDLVALLNGLGFDGARSLLQSGNLLFRTHRKSPPQLERLLESEVQKRIGLETRFFVRSADEWKSVIAQNPFADEAKRDPAHLLVMFLEGAPKNVAALQDAIKGREIVRAGGRHLYIVYPDGIGTSKLTHALIEKTLGMRATGRNWNTVLKLGQGD